MKILDRVALVLGIIGALNWGIVGLFRFDCVAADGLDIVGFDGEGALRDACEKAAALAATL